MKAIVLLAAVVLMAIPAAAQDSGWIGVSIDDQREGGPVIRRVETGSPAEMAGLREGDVILEFDKQQVIGVQQLTRLVRETPVGRTVDVKVRRNNQEQTFKLTAERGSGLRAQRFEFDVPGVHLFADRMRDFPRIQVNTTYVLSGIRVEDLTDQLRDYFGVGSNNGVLVTSVDAGSAAAKAGLRAGDVITAVDSRNIRAAADFSREMRAGTRPVLKIFRDKQEREIKIE